jgi:protein SCO1/2
MIPDYDRTRKFLRGVMIGLAAVLALLVAVRLKLAHHSGEAFIPSSHPASVGTIKDFELTESNGRPFGLRDLRGHAWVADFIYTRCQGPCPVLSHRMSELQNTTPTSANIRFVSFTVDPSYDTPRVLTAYAGQFGAEKNRWFFLTGNQETVFRVILGNFHLAAQNGGTPESVVHSTYFVLVDAQARVLGYYDSLDEKALARLESDMKHQG